MPADRAPRLPIPVESGEKPGERGTLFPPPRSRIPLPTFDLYRPLSIFCNLLLRILNVRIERVTGGGEKGGGLARWPRATNANETKRDERVKRERKATVASRSQSGRVVPYYHPVGRCRPNLPSHLPAREMVSPLSPSVFVPPILSARAQPSISLFQLELEMAPAGTVVSRYHLDNLYAGGSLKLHERREKSARPR